MPGGDFLDTNVLLYALSIEHPQKQAIAAEILAKAFDNDTCISFQVVQEALAGIVRGATSLGPDDSLRFLEETLVPLWRVHPSARLYGRALAVQARYRYHFYDSLIIAAAIVAGCSRLLSEDLQHGQRIEGVTISNPFL